MGLRLLCRGVVQGVGFRPALCRLAAELGLVGSLRNISGAVQLELAGSRAALETFLERLPGRLPAPARLEPLEPLWLEPPLPLSLAAARGLHLSAAGPLPLGQGWAAPSLMADLAPCGACLSELADPTSRRFRYPFLSCSHCGPRYSIATAEPWCRAHTTLAAFPLCRQCRDEFQEVSDRRFHAETIACPACGPRLQLLRATPGFTPWPCDDPLEQATALLEAGGVLGLQGVGGFQLLVDGWNPEAVARLRRRKGRPGKPFALLVADVAAMADLVEVDPLERAALSDGAAPIVLLRRRPGREEALAGVAPGAEALGVMLPASPLHQLLAQALGRPLVCTSGNRSGEPLCTDPAEACQVLEGIADGLLLHNRPIARPLDDSVLQMIAGRPSLLRRARGHAPQPLLLAAAGEGDGPHNLIALGSDLKSAPALLRHGRCWLAPHLGDLAEGRSLERLCSGVEDWRRAEQGPGAPVLCDAHPGYLSHQLATSLPEGSQAVPHHLAHGLAVVAEHRLSPPLLMVAFDGLGHGGGVSGAAGGTGPDGELPVLRGGEVLLLQADEEDGTWSAGTAASLLPFPLPGGVRALQEPRRAALGLLHRAAAMEHPGARRVRRAFPAADLALLQQALATGLQSPLCSSAGRLCDGAASLLGLVQVLRYEGQGGLRLQAAARRGLAAMGVVEGSLLPLLPVEHADHLWLDWRPLLRGLLERLCAGAADTDGGRSLAPPDGSQLLQEQDPGGRRQAAAWFHLALAEGLASSLVQLAARRGLPSDGAVVLSGGCFQNRLLLEAMVSALGRRGLGCRWSQAVPCNDGGLALGQLEAARRAVRWRG